MKRYAIALVLFANLLPFSTAFAAGGQLYLSQSEGTYTVGKAFTVSVLADTAGVPVSAVEGELAYNPLDVSVESISTDNSVLTLWSTQPSYDGAAGTISFSGWAPNNYSGKDGLMITLTLVPLRTGVITLKFNSGAMLAADGKGSNIITAMTSGSYATQPKQIDTPAPAVEAASSSPATPENSAQQPAAQTVPATPESANAAALPLAVAATSSLAAVIDSGVSEFASYALFFILLVLTAFAVAYYFHRKKIAF